MKPNVLLFDIETSPNLAYVWGKWEQDVIAYKREWYIISFSAKWLRGEQITKALPDYKGYKRNKHDDKALVKHLWKLFDKADILVAHNGDQFDIKKVSARFSFHGINPPSPYKSADTKKIAKRYYNFNSNSLNDLGQYLKLGKKVKTGGFDLWLDCIEKDQPKAWKLMKKYNAQDVRLLEKVYLHFLPFDRSHPNMGMWIGLACPKCGSKSMVGRGIARTTTGGYHKLQCKNCGGWSNSKIKQEKIATLKSL